MVSDYFLNTRKQSVKEYHATLTAKLKILILKNNYLDQNKLMKTFNKTISKLMPRKKNNGQNTA